MKSTLRLNRCVVAGLLWCTTAAAQALTPYTAEYDLTWDVGMTLSGTASQRMSLENDTWRLQQNANASLGSLNETSIFRLNETGRILPLEFVRKTTLLGRTKEQQTRFNWNQRQAQMGDVTVDLDDNVFDPLTLQLELRSALNDGRSLSLKLADRGRIREYPIENLGLQTLDTPDGPLSVVHLRYTKNEQDHTDLWFDPAREHLMIGMRATRDGKVFELTLRSAQLSPRDAIVAKPQ
ncbi:MAG: DUF3108 domain-containing protein [Litorivicinus sp.]